MVPKRFKKCFFLWFLVFSNFFEIFRFFSQNDVFRLFAHDYSFLIEKSFKSPRNMAYFVPNFVLNFSPKSIRVHQVQPTHKWAKIAEKSFKMGLLGTQISRDWDSRIILGLKIQHMYSAVNDHENSGYKPKFIGTIKWYC